MTNALATSLHRARLAGVPLVAITTSDQYATREAVRSLGLSRKDDKKPAHPVFGWDSVVGLRAFTETAATWMRDAGLNDADAARTKTAPIMSMLDLAPKLPEESWLVMLNVGRHLSEPRPVQAVANLRDTYKASRRTLILLAPDWRLPAEIAHDVLLLNEPLPGDVMLSAIVDECYKAYELPAPPPAERTRAVVALRGTSAFEAEQIAAMSLTRGEMDHEQLWDLKTEKINSVPGLTLSRGKLKFDDVKGLDSICQMAREEFSGKAAPQLIVRWDEIEKLFAGAGTDTSGVSTYALGHILSWMEDNEASGLLAVGVGGTGKTLFSYALGAEFECPVVTMDVGATKSQYVGSSEAALREAMRVIAGIGGKRCFFVGTCNAMDSLPMPFVRRFTGGIWYFDVPGEDEKEVLWKHYCKKFELAKGQINRDEVRDHQWTGAEIRNCCRIAWSTGKTLREAARRIVPVAQSKPEDLKRLRSMAHERFLSASKPGVYLNPDIAASAGDVASRPSRRLSREE